MYRGVAHGNLTRCPKTYRLTATKNSECLHLLCKESHDDKNRGTVQVTSVKFLGCTPFSEVWKARSRMSGVLPSQNCPEPCQPFPISDASCPPTLADLQAKLLRIECCCTKPEPALLSDPKCNNIQQLFLSKTGGGTNRQQQQPGLDNSLQHKVLLPGLLNGKVQSGEQGKWCRANHIWGTSG